MKNFLSVFKKVIYIYNNYLIQNLRAGIIKSIKFYQEKISPKKPPVCRFVPTCSNYAIEAIERFGVIRGLGLSMKRILRCNPLFKGGYDPVPQKEKNKYNL